MTYVGKKPADIIATAVDTTTGTFSGDLTVDTSTLYVDSANNRVGIGTSSPSTILTVSSGASSASVHSYSNLEIESSSHSALQFSGSTAGEQWIWFADDTTATPVGGITYYHAGPYMGFRVEGSERMRIDSSGNLLVGKTDQTANVAGTEIEGSGTIVSTRDNNTNMFLNRKTSDGNLIEFRKDNTVVGSIGTFGSALYIASPDGTDAGLRVGNSTVLPVTTTGALRDNAINLGSASARWKDLYLSGGVTTGTESNFVSATSTNVVAKSTNGNGGYLNYSGLSSGGTTTFSVTHNGNVYAADGINLGGTGSANRLDDYEEGTWTPAFRNDGSTTYSIQYGRYVKIGSLVMAAVHLDVSSNNIGTNAIQIETLPFTSTNDNANAYGSSSSLHCNNWNSGVKPDHFIISPNSTFATGYGSVGQAGLIYPNGNDLGTGNLIVTLIYRTDS